MENNTAIIIAVVTSILTIVAMVIVARYIWKRPWILFVTAAVCGATAYLTQQPAWWGVTVVAAVLGGLATKPKPAKGAPKKAAAKDAHKGPRYKSLAEFADVIATDPTAIDSNLHSIFTEMRDEIGSIYDATTNDFDKAVLAGPLASLDKIANAKIQDKSKPMFPTLCNLADAIAEKDVKLDSALRGIFLEIYDHVELYTPNDATEGAYEPLAYDVERTLFPNDGPSMSQAESASRRQAKIEAAIRHKSAFSNAASTASGAMCE